MPRNRTQLLFERGSYVTLMDGAESGRPGKVIKQVNLALLPQEAKELGNAHSRFTHILEARGIPVLKSEMAVHDSENNTYVSFVQDKVPEHLLLNRVFEESQPERVLDLYEKLLHLSIDFHQNHDAVPAVKFDPKPQNFALLEGKITLIDTFPPLIKDSQGVTPSTALRILSEGQRPISYRAVFRPVAKVLDALTAIDRKRLAKRTLATGFSAPFRTFSSLLYGSIRTRPEMKNQFEEKTQQVLESRYGRQAPELIRRVFKRSNRLNRGGALKRVLRQ